jgi:hypothetical protein
MNGTTTATTTAKALSVSGLPRATKSPRNDGHCHDKTATTKWKKAKGISETATPHPALSRKGRGNVCVIIYLSEMQLKFSREGRPHGVAPTVRSLIK